MFLYIENGINQASDLIETMQKESYNAKTFKDILNILKITEEEKNILKSNNSSEILLNGIATTDNNICIFTYQSGKFIYQYTRGLLLLSTYNMANNPEGTKTITYRNYIKQYGENGMYKTGQEIAIMEFSKNVNTTIIIGYSIATLYNLIATILIYKLLKPRS